MGKRLAPRLDASAPRDAANSIEPVRTAEAATCGACDSEWGRESYDRRALPCVSVQRKLSSVCSLAVETGRPYSWQGKIETRRDEIKTAIASRSPPRDHHPQSTDAGQFGPVCFTQAVVALPSSQHHDRAGVFLELLHVMPNTCKRCGRDRSSSL